MKTIFFTALLLLAAQAHAGDKVITCSTVDKFRTVELVKTSDGEFLTTITISDDSSARHAKRPLVLSSVKMKASVEGSSVILTPSNDVVSAEDLYLEVHNAPPYVVMSISITNRTKLMDEYLYLGGTTGGYLLCDKKLSAFLK